MKSNEQIFNELIVAFNGTRMFRPRVKKKIRVHKRHQGPKECARRIRQGKASSCYNKTTSLYIGL